MYFSCQEKKKNEKTKTSDQRQQSIHDISTRTAPCRRENVCAPI
jgi:hypothetical protein